VVSKWPSVRQEEIISAYKLSTRSYFDEREGVLLQLLFLLELKAEKSLQPAYSRGRAFT